MYRLLIDGLCSMIDCLSDRPLTFGISPTPCAGPPAGAGPRVRGVTVGAGGGSEGPANGEGGGGVNRQSMSNESQGIAA